jgi:hypothetical protein
MRLIKQISIFAENKPGKIERLAGILGEDKINILAFNVTSMGDFGVLKFVVDKPELAYKGLKEAGFAVTMNEVLGIDMADKPGGLFSVAKKLREKGVNIDNAYVYINESRKKALLLIETKEIAKAKNLKNL